MGFDFGVAKRLARQVVHDTLAVPVIFMATPSSMQIEGLTARWHTRLVREGDVEGTGAQVIEDVDQIVFDRGQLASYGIAPYRGAVVIFPQYENLTVILDARLPYEGPVEEIWLVTRQ